MTPTAPDTLRAVAALVIRRGLDGRTFPLAVERTASRYRTDAPEPIRRVAAVVRFRHPGASPAEVAALLTDEAEAVDGAPVA